MYCPVLKANLDHSNIVVVESNLTRDNDMKNTTFFLLTSL